MKEELKIALLQADLKWEDPDYNIQNFQKMIAALDKEIELVVLPEMFTTGFTMNAEKMAEEAEGKAFLWMRTMANKYDLAITGSVVVREDNKFYNRLYFVFPDGQFHIYDKRHTFTLAGENKVYASGDKKLIVSYKGWKICPMICYDLRFPVWARNVEDYDLLIFVANWPEKRVAAWDALLKARAIENMSYCIGVNRIGQDGNNVPHLGHSMIYDGLGAEILAHPQEKESILTATLLKSHISKIRSSLKFLQDRDTFILK